MSEYFGSFMLFIIVGAPSIKAPLKKSVLISPVPAPNKPSPTPVVPPFNAVAPAVPHPPNAGTIVVAPNAVAAAPA